MNICIIHGSPRKGNTYRATTIFMKELQKCGEVEFTEFFLPKAMPHFCNGCFTCFEKGEDKCPHAQYVEPILDAMRQADGLIFTTPVYVMGESAQMKALLDHLAHIYMPHRPMEEMFSKVAMVISTAAGAGTKHATKAIARSLQFWGVKRIYSCRFNLFAEDWDSMKLQKQHRFEKNLGKKANLFYKSVAKREELRIRISTRAIFYGMKATISSYDEGYLDKEYWEQKGWLDGKKRPF